MKKKFKYIVLEDEEGGRFYSLYSENYRKDWYKLIKLTNSEKEAQNLVERTSTKNLELLFINNLFKIYNPHTLQQNQKGETSC